MVTRTEGYRWDWPRIRMQLGMSPAPPPCLSLTVTTESNTPIPLHGGKSKSGGPFLTFHSCDPIPRSSYVGTGAPVGPQGGTLRLLQGESREPAPAPPSPPRGPGSVIPKQGAPCSGASGVQ